MFESLDITSSSSIIDALEALSSQSLGLWCLIGVALVFFMQAGFAMVETGFTRAKNAGNIIMKNLMDFSLGAVAFWIIGAGLLLGDSVGGFIGVPMNPFQMDADFFPAFMFNMVFCATAATIVSGAMAERTKFSSYCVYSIIISMLVYPISAHWIWNSSGWLAQLGFVDFAGSTAVHMVGGVSALIGAIILGPRMGKYKTVDGKKVSKAIPGHSLTLGALGVFILWFAWYGFNGAAASSVNSAASIFSTTTIAAAVSTITAMAITWIKYGKPDVSMTLNGSLAGLVAITAGCANVSVTGSFFIGLAAGFIVVFGCEFLDKKCHVDDPVGAVAVHGMCGATGTVLVGIFDTSYGLISGPILNKGVAFVDCLKFFSVQILGVLAVAAYVTVVMVIVFLLIKKVMGLRVSKEEEALGLDIMEHGLTSSYADFTPAYDPDMEFIAPTTDKDAKVPVAQAVEVVKQTKISDGSLPKLTKISIITRPEKFEALKHALDALGIKGMTLSNVQGCGMQRGNDKYYRGVKLDSHLLPKIKVELVVTKVPVDIVVEAAKGVLYTGRYGDGKIFIYDVENVIKIRTGEEGYDALQDDDDV